jgi:hypothetical protein
MLEPKVPAIGAATGFVLSFLTGLVSGASFPIVLLRAFFMAILFGALVVLLRVLLMKFVPDLLGEAPIETSPSENTGNVVNITIDDPGRGDASSGVADIQSADGLVPDFLAQTANTMKPAGSQADFAEDLSPTGNFVPDAVAAKSSQSVRQVPVAESAHSGGEKVQRSSDGLDVLPDLQDFIPQKRLDENDEEDEVEPVVHTGMINSGFGASSFVGSGADTKNSSVEAETMAKAIRTILSNDS